MPIKFRCRHCRQFLGISRAQAGEITDCPMCGKSIRVPNLDGTIDPIPAPELDLEDSQLVQALGELAEIGRGPATVELTSPPRVLETREATVIVPAAESVARTVIVPISPAAASPQEDEDTIIQGGGDGATVDEEAGPLRALAEALDRPSNPPPQQPGTPSRRMWWIAGTAGLAALLVMGLVWATSGRAKTDSASLPAEPPTDSPPSVAEPAIPPVPEEASATPTVQKLTGRALYLNEQGERLPDRGASVLFFPKTKLGTVRLDVSGFLAGAEEIDAQVAEAAIRVLGGDVTHADEEGQFRVNAAPADGHLLVISRHQERPTGAEIDSVLQELLAQYFWRPASLLGRLDFRLIDIQAANPASTPLQILFSRE